METKLNECFTVFLPLCGCFKTIKIHIRKKYTLSRAAFVSPAWDKCMSIWDIGVSFTIETKGTKENQVKFFGI